MIVGLLIISLLLHGLTILWIFTLMKRMELVTLSKKELDQTKNELEDLLFSYTEEMKEENERLVRQVKVKQQERPPVNKIINQTKSNQIEETRDEEKDRYENYHPPTIDQAPVYERSITAEVLSLAQQGQSREQIAKSLDIGIGEVELMLRFHDKS